MEKHTEKVSLKNEYIWQDEVCKIAPALLNYNIGDKPHEKQLQFHADLARNRWVFGGNRTGKTECGAVETVLWALCLHRHREFSRATVGWVVSLTSQVQRDVAQAKVLKYLDKSQIAEVVMKSGSKKSPENGVIDYILVKNVRGSLSKIGFKNCGQGRERFQGVGLDYVWFDEEPPFDIYQECLMRTLDTRGSIWGTMTPLKGRTWVYETIYLRAKQKPEAVASPSEAYTDKVENNQNVKSLNCETDDTLPGYCAIQKRDPSRPRAGDAQDDRKRLYASGDLFSPPEGEFLSGAACDGGGESSGSFEEDFDFDDCISAITMSWDDNPYLNSRETKRMEGMLSADALESRKYGRFMDGTGLVFSEFSAENIIEPFEVADSWYKVVSIDPGFTNPLAALWIAVDGDGNVFVTQDYMQAGKTVPYHAEQILELSEQVGFTRSDGGCLPAIIDSSALQKHLGSSSSVAEQFRECGIAVDTNVNKSLQEGIQKMKSLFCDLKGQRKIFIFKNCTNTIRELRDYWWGDSERPLKKNDHCIDALRYFIATMYRGREKKPLTELQELKFKLERKNRYEGWIGG